MDAKERSVSPARPATGELSFRDIGALLRARVYLIILVGIAAGVVAGALSFAIPVTYRSSVLVAPVSDDAVSPFSGAASSLGALAALGNIRLGDSDVSKTDLTLATLRSRQLAAAMLQRDDVGPIVLAAKWNVLQRRHIVDTDAYDHEQRRWLKDIDDDGEPGPNIDTVYEAYNRLVSIESNRNTGLITIAVTWYDPEQAAAWATAVVEEINRDMRVREVEEARRSLEYLETEISRTSLTGLRDLMYRLSEEKIQTIMLANVRPEFALKTVDPAVAPTKRHRPNRLLLAALGTASGILVTCLLIILRAPERRGPLS